MKIILKENYWIPISYRDINDSPKIDKLGRTTLLAPSDVPRFLRISIHDNGDNRLVCVEFKYSSDSEQIKSKELNETLKVDYGINSKRVYKLELTMSVDEYESIMASIKTKSDHRQRQKKKEDKSFVDIVMNSLKKFGIRNIETISKIRNADFEYSN